MNRLWVRFALVITGILVLVISLPLLYGAAVEVGWAPEPQMSQVFAEIEDVAPPEALVQFEARMQRFIRAYFLRSFVTAALVGVAAGVWLSRMLAAPLQALETGAQAIATQDLSHRVPVEGSREIQAVAHSFNQMAAQLEQAETLRQQLLSDVAHELRHPLHILRGNLQAMLDGVYPMNEEEIGRLLNHTDQLATLVNDLHQLAQAEAQRLPLHKAETNIAELVKDTAVLFRPLARQRGINLRVELLGELPVLAVDAARLRQTVQNLLDNALQHIGSGGEIIVSVSQGPRAVQIAVADNGAGIAPDQLEHVFDRFYRGDNARQRHHNSGSAGLGLAIARAIVEAHGGTLRAESEGPDRGSVFTIRLPKA
jgi:signal transduction histidine kinase